MSGLKNIAFVYPCDRNIGWTLIMSLIREFKFRDYCVDEYNLINESNIKDYKILDKLYSKRYNYDAVFVLDLGFLYDYRIHRNNYSCPVIALFGDDPQNFTNKMSFAGKIKNFIASRIFSRNHGSEFFYGNDICAKQYDIVFTHHKSAVGWHKTNGIEKAFWLPYWCDTELNVSAGEAQYDVVTVMTPKKERMKFLDAMEKSDKFKFKNGIGIYGNECIRFYRKGKIIFNKSNHGEFTMRIPEALGTGRLVLTDKVNDDTGVFDLFRPGEHLAVYSDVNDLKKKIIYYLNNDAERERIAKTGMIEVIGNHSQKQRTDFILEKVNDFKNNIIQKSNSVSIHILSFNRPHLLKLTLESLKYSLRNCKISREVILYDQNSCEKTKKIIREYTGFIDKIIFADENIGMALGWNYMFDISNGDYIITLENDWLCNSAGSGWLEHGIEIMENHGNMAFVKLRKLFDGQLGLGSLHHEPWSVKPFPSDVVKVGYLKDKSEYYYSSPEYNCFTFNPVIMRRDFRKDFSEYYVDDSDNATPLRSGEDKPTAMWREQKKWISATLLDGPFEHIGFYSRRDFAKYLPKKYAKFLMNKLISNNCFQV